MIVANVSDPVAPAAPRHPLRWMMVGAAVIAMGTRAWLILSHAGLFGLHYYDDGVYYASAAALLAGQMPYEDFVFLHPPGVVLILSPFAFLGAQTSDPVGLAAARVAFWLLGGLNAALVVRIAGRHGRMAAAVGGLFYALWFPAIYAERVPLLEPPGNTALLVALLLLARTGPSATWQRYLAGAAIGVAACVKIWMVVPLAVVVLWQLTARGRRPGLQIAVGAACGAAVILLPFMKEGRTMFRMVVLDQLGRAPEHDAFRRATGIAGLRPWQLSHLSDAWTGALLTVVTLFVVLALGAVWRTGGNVRWYGALLVANIAFLLWTPTYFEHYPTFAAVPLALLFAVALSRVPDAGRWVSRRVAAAAFLSISLAALWVPTLWMAVGHPFPGRQLAAVVGNRPCVVSDDPTALALMDVLTRDLRLGCPPIVDVSGVSFDRYIVHDAAGQPLPRAQNPRWQRHISTYLRSGSAMVLVDPRLTGLSPATMRRVRRLPLLIEADGYQLRGKR